jgi:PD-(D/E)XK endonuclease
MCHLHKLGLDREGFCYMLALCIPLEKSIMGDTSQKGLLSHTAVLNRLVQLGCDVLLPWADHLGYDLAYYVTEEHRSYGFFVHKESYLARIQVKTAWLSKDGTALEFNTSTVSAGKRGNKKTGYEGKAEYFGVYTGTPVKWAKDYEI